ncbi:MAG TPA: DUF1015 domain-containing protein [Bryobacteraceae bacterium]|nr:DUF1015 domain-containing protein [Bryobacteraceae bacterium]
MARIFPFQPYRYSPAAGDPQQLVTQPYDKSSPEMQWRYLSQSPYNLVRVDLGERFPTDTESKNVYTRSAAQLDQWIADGILVREDSPSFYAYLQEFALPDTGERLTRKGFIGLGAVEDYSAGIVHRHEQTLSGPKKDRRDLLNATRCHFGQIFMLFDDPQCRVDSVLDAASQGAPLLNVTDEYDTRHALYRISHPRQIGELQSAMADKKLLIADGHHRYETALAYRDAHPELEGAKSVMMTFVNLRSAGLRILATHRVLAGIDSFDAQTFLEKAGARFQVCRFDTANAMQQTWEQPALHKIRFGAAFRGVEGVYMLERDREEGALDVEVLHTELIEGALGITQDAVRDGLHIRSIRGLETAVEEVLNGDAEIALLLEATTVQQVANCAFNGGCMPQKSTDFYPKLLSGLTLYRIET